MIRRTIKMIMTRPESLGVLWKLTRPEDRATGHLKRLGHMAAGRTLPYGKRKTMPHGHRKNNTTGKMKGLTTWQMAGRGHMEAKGRATWQRE